MATIAPNPRGGGGVIQTGFNQTLWGSSQNNLFGYIRLGVEAEGVQDFLTTGGVVEIFPISLLGLQLGYRHTNSHLDFPDYDCQNYHCRGSWSESYFRIPAFVKVFGFSLTGAYQQSRWKNDESSPHSHFIEPTSSLPLLNFESETSDHLRWTILYDTYANLQVGYFYGKWDLPDDTDSILRERQSHTWLALVRWATSNSKGDRSRLSVTLGAGEMRTALHTIEPTAVAFLRYSPFAKMGF